MFFELSVPQNEGGDYLGHLGQHWQPWMKIQIINLF